MSEHIAEMKSGQKAIKEAPLAVLQEQLAQLDPTAAFEALEGAIACIEALQTQLAPAQANMLLASQKSEEAKDILTEATGDIDQDLSYTRGCAYISGATIAGINNLGMLEGTLAAVISQIYNCKLQMDDEYLPTWLLTNETASKNIVKQQSILKDSDAQIKRLEEVPD